MSTLKTKHHASGFRPDITLGSGPVYEIRRALNLSQIELAGRVGCARGTIQNAERDGTWPRNRAVQSNLRGLASEAGVKVEEWTGEGGVFL